MPQWTIASVFAMLALAAAWGIYSSSATGITRDGVWEFEADQHPVGFFVLVLAKFIALCFCIAVVLHAVGLVAMDPIVAVKQILSFLPGP